MAQPAYYRLVAAGAAQSWREAWLAISAANLRRLKWP